ncbi:hypothetical protein [Comamonas thiooxydans]|nr:hypothetical protein [Comamonas thiooxydans]
MNCAATEYRWLMEWAVFLLIILAFGIAAAYRWAKAPREEENHE